MQIFLILVAILLLGGAAAAAAGFEALIIFVLCAAVGMVVIGLVLSSVAKREVRYWVSAPRSDVAQLVYAEFKKVGWKPVDGRGEFNYRSRGIGLNIAGTKIFGGGIEGLEHPVVSIDLEDNPQGGTLVTFWMSQWESRTGIVGACDRVLSKRWMLRRRLASVGETSKAAA